MGDQVVYTGGKRSPNIGKTPRFCCFEIFYYGLDFLIAIIAGKPNICNCPNQKPEMEEVGSEAGWLTMVESVSMDLANCRAVVST